MRSVVATACLLALVGCAVALGETGSRYQSLSRTGVSEGRGVSDVRLFRTTYAYEEENCTGTPVAAFSRLVSAGDDCASQECVDGTRVACGSERAIPPGGDGVCGYEIFDSPGCPDGAVLESAYYTLGACVPLANQSVFFAGQEENVEAVRVISCVPPNRLAVGQPALIDTFSDKTCTDPVFNEYAPNVNVGSFVCSDGPSSLFCNSGATDLPLSESSSRGYCGGPIFDQDGNQIIVQYNWNASESTSRLGFNAFSGNSFVTGDFYQMEASERFYIIYGPLLPSLEPNDILKFDLAIDVLPANVNLSDVTVQWYLYDDGEGGTLSFPLNFSDAELGVPKSFSIPLFSGNLDLPFFRPNGLTLFLAKQNEIRMAGVEDDPAPLVARARNLRIVRPTPETCRSPDINGDDSINLEDMGLLLLGWGSCPIGPCPTDIFQCERRETNILDVAVLLDSWRDLE